MEEIFGIKKLMNGKGDENTKIGGEPIWLAEGGKNSGLDILNPQIFVDAEMFGNGVN
jgi:hypothetical protein